MSRRDSVGATPPGSNVRLGTRVVVQGRHKGTLAFVGSVHYAKGLFAGVELDDPAGKNNGTVKGHSYFKCKPHHGMLVRPWDVETLASFLDTRPHVRVLVAYKMDGGASTPQADTPASMLGARTPAPDTASGAPGSTGSAGVTGTGAGSRESDSVTDMPARSLDIAFDDSAASEPPATTGLGDSYTAGYSATASPRTTANVIGTVSPATSSPATMRTRDRLAAAANETAQPAARSPPARATDTQAKVAPAKTAPKAIETKTPVAEREDTTGGTPTAPPPAAFVLLFGVALIAFVLISRHARASTSGGADGGGSGGGSSGRIVRRR